MPRRSLPLLLSLAVTACGSPTPPERPTLRVAPTTLAITEGSPASIVLTARPEGQSVGWWVATKPTWLRLSADSGTVRGTATLTADVVTPPSQAPGAIAGELVFGTPSGTVTVQLDATVPRLARITMSPTSIAIPAGSDTGQVTLTNTGHAPGSWHATSSVSWLTLPAIEGVVEVGQSAVVKVVAHRASLPPGTSSASIAILADGAVSAVQLPVTVTTPP